MKLSGDEAQPLFCRYCFLRIFRTQNRNALDLNLRICLGHTT